MKKLILLFALAAISFISEAQITLEQNYPASTAVAQLASSGFKYYLADYTNNQCKIYNTDHSLWKTIAMTVPTGRYLYSVTYVSDALFNTDSKVELAYTWYAYDTTLFYYTYNTRVIDEDGIELLNVPGCSFIDVVSAGAKGTKMLAYVYDYSKVYYTTNTLVYSLPGTLPAYGMISRGNEYLHKAYPNPAQAVVNIPYELPEGTGQGQVLLINGSGQVLKSYRVDRTFHELTIPTGDLPVGVLLYQLKTSEGIIGSGKLIHN